MWKTGANMDLWLDLHCKFYNFNYKCCLDSNLSIVFNCFSIVQCLGWLLGSCSHLWRFARSSSCHLPQLWWWHWRPASDMQPYLSFLQGWWTCRESGSKQPRKVGRVVLGNSACHLGFHAIERVADESKDPKIHLERERSTRWKPRSQRFKKQDEAGQRPVGGNEGKTPWIWRLLRRESEGDGGWGGSPHITDLPPWTLDD